MGTWRLAAAMALLIWMPAPAAADWLLTPTFGTTFGADTHGREHFIFGAAVGHVDEDVFGWELDFSLAPDFFEGQHDGFFFDGDSRVATVMINGLLGVPSSFHYREDGARVRPFAAVGLGLLQARAVTGGGTADDLFESVVHELAWNIGGGATAFFSERFGLRADVRYFRSFQNQEPSWTRGLDVDVAPGHFDYLRAAVGLTLRFPN